MPTLFKGIKPSVLATAVIVSCVSLTAFAAAVTGSSKQPTAPVQSSKQSENRTTETITEDTVINFESSTIEDSKIQKGKQQVVQAGVAGNRRLIFEVEKVNGVVTQKKQVDEQITPAVNEVRSIGTYVYTPPVKPVVKTTPSNCDPNYTPCVPISAGDLDCPDIGFSVRVIGSDPHRFDRDRDGYGCESY